jgi:hypothetical protein
VEGNRRIRRRVWRRGKEESLGRWRVLGGGESDKEESLEGGKVESLERWRVCGGSRRSRISTRPGT